MKMNYSNQVKRNKKITTPLMIEKSSQAKTTPL